MCVYIYIIKRSQEIYIYNQEISRVCIYLLFDSIDRVSMVMIMMDDPKADGQWGFHHNQTHCYWWLYRLSHLCELQSEVSTDFYEKT